MATGLSDGGGEGRFWRLRRLRAMSPREVGARAADAFRYTRLYLRRASAARVSFAAAPAPVQAVQLPCVSTKLRGRIIAGAGRWLAHRGRLFERQNVHFDGTIDWHRDYASGMVAPRRCSALINHRDRRRVGDVRYIWELNRLQHLVELALAAAWTGEDAYAAEIETQCRSWLRENPPLTGVNWKSPLEAGMRLVSWAYVAVLTQRAPRLTRFFRHDMAQTLYHHQHFIGAVHSKHSSANNHLVGEMAGLFLASTLWPWFEDSRRWNAAAREALHGAMIEQVEADGVAKERAIEYQLFLMELFLASAAMASLAGAPFAAEYWERLRAMASFIDAVRDRAGHFPRWGDGDGSQAVALPDTPEERAAALASCAADDGGAGEIETAADLRLWLLRWGQCPRLFPGERRRTTPGDALDFPHGGYAVLSSARGSDDELIAAFDAAPLGLAPLAAHAHADALSIWVSAGGREFLVDPGTFCYYDAPEWRDYFRGTGAHNTIRVDGVDQSVTGGRFLWSWAAPCRLEPAQAGAGDCAVAGSHDGYLRLRDPLVHFRRIRLSRETRSIRIQDRLECRGHHRVEIFFHFASACSVRQVGARSFLAEHADQRLRLCLDPLTEAVLYRASEAPICGWQSPAFGEKTPCWTLVAQAETHGTTQLETWLTAERTRADARP
jgi:hypothetical protein